MVWSPDSIDAWDSELRLSRRRMSFICDLISDSDDSVYTCVVSEHAMMITAAGVEAGRLSTHCLIVYRRAQVQAVKPCYLR